MRFLCRRHGVYGNGVAKERSISSNNSALMDLPAGSEADWANQPRYRQTSGHVLANAYHLIYAQNSLILQK